MTTNTIIAIAELCRATGFAGDVWKSQSQESAHMVQTVCQQYYLKCVKEKTSKYDRSAPDYHFADALSECVLENIVLGKK